jgi:hypothetical protein
MAPDAAATTREPGRRLEDVVFRSDDARLVERRRQLQAVAEDREALTMASGIRHPEVLDTLSRLGISAETSAALSLVPLLEVAWADGSLDGPERATILARAEESGITAGSFTHGLLEAWLDHRPDRGLVAAWTQVVHRLVARLSPAEIGAMQSAVLERARSVARASGSGASHISSAEAAVLDTLARTFTTPGA